MFDVSLPTVLFLIFMVLLFLLYVLLQWKIGKYHRPYRLVSQNICVLTNQQEDIYNISSRVQGQGQWPTHDAHVSLDNFAITNELNKYNDDPPTYEEAMSIATSINNNTVVPAVVPKTTITPTSTTATSTSN
ncbi:hypothetical protein MTP99_001010 [Tenebrio molitor]|jgi:hypothetical protein|uniref:uncharacterized protein isoform X5 n=1 Tax=Tenebrio molitor TaxID=7067 RepID=UPI0026F977FA|nr:hypothetical protein MTP99_001008 [Tenebrio molitor]KAJ3637560.1 hypothetical protein MTP99_001010 [Tenebrio molitor]